MLQADVDADELQAAAVATSRHTQTATYKQDTVECILTSWTA